MKEISKTTFLRRIENHTIIWPPVVIEDKIYGKMVTTEGEDADLMWATL